MSKRARTRIFTEDDVARNARPGSCWVTRGRKVYDVTRFMADHPGGDDLILSWAGKDVDAVMAEPSEHEHSDAAYTILEDFAIGVLGARETTCDESNDIDEHFVPTDTRIDEDFERNQFLDLSQPLLMQVLTSNFSKSFYLQQVHQPRHLPESPRLFGPAPLEALTRTQWWVVPLVWLPVAAALFYRSVSVPQGSLAATIPAFLFGNLFWTFIEYVMHRFLFHIDDFLPDHPYALTLHFLLHGIHHYIPMDRLRLVMPPILFLALSYPFTRLAHALFPSHFANGVIAGAYTFYVLYDCGHYALHHTKLPQYLATMKAYHMAHHFKDPESGFGVTSKMWDYVFGTVLQVQSVPRVAKIQPL